MRLAASLAAAALAATLAAPTHFASAEGRRAAQLAHGAKLYAETCAVCHGDDGQAGAGYPTPIWGSGAKISRFETAMGLFEYNQMLMPFDDPSKISDEDKWAIVAYLLENHGTAPPDQGLGPDNAAAVPIR